MGGGRLLHRLRGPWVCPVWKHRDEAGVFEDQEALGPGYGWVPDKRSRLRWELSLSPILLPALTQMTRSYTQRCGV